METNLAAGIVDGRTLRDWWENAPHGAFQNRCAELGIKLEFGDEIAESKRYLVEIRYTFKGRGYQTIEVEAENEKDAEKKALEKFDSTDVDFYNAEVVDTEVGSVEETR